MYQARSRNTKTYILAQAVTESQIDVCATGTTMKDHRCTGLRGAISLPSYADQRIYTPLYIFDKSALVKPLMRIQLSNVPDLVDRMSSESDDDYGSLISACSVRLRSKSHLFSMISAVDTMNGTSQREYKTSASVPT